MYLAHRIQQPIPKLLVRIFANLRPIRTFLRLLFDFLFLFAKAKSWKFRILSFWIGGWIWWARYFYIFLKMKLLLLLSSPIYSFIFLSKSQSILFLFYDYIVEEIHQTSWINLWNENIKRSFLSYARTIHIRWSCLLFRPEFCRHLHILLSNRSFILTMI